MFHTHFIQDKFLTSAQTILLITALIMILNPPELEFDDA